MPKYYCDYCDVYLTHDSSSVRKAHNNGKNHIMNVRNYYAELGQDKAQAIIDEITKAYECAGQVGFPPQYGYIPGMIPTVVAPVVNAPPYASVPPPLMMHPRPPVGNGAPGTVAATVPILTAPPPPPPVIGGPGIGTTAPPPPPPVIGGPGIGTTVPPNPLPPTPTGIPSTLPIQQPFLAGALPPPGGSASFNAPNLPPQYPPGQPPRGVKRQMEE